MPRRAADVSAKPSDLTLGPFDRLEHEAPLAYRSMREAAILRRWERDEVICHRGDPATYICIVQTGLMAVRYGSEERKIQVALLEAGMLWGEVALLRARQTARHDGSQFGMEPRRSAEIAAFGGPAEGRVLGFEQLNRLRARYPEIDRLLVVTLCERVGRLTEQLSAALTRGAHDRLRYQVLTMHEHAAAVSDSSAPWIPISDRELGRMVGLGRQRVNDLLRQDACIERSKGRVGFRVGDPGRLLELIDAGG